MADEPYYTPEYSPGRTSFSSRPWVITFPRKEGYANRVQMMNANFDPRRFKTEAAAQKVADALNAQRAAAKEPSHG